MAYKVPSLEEMLGFLVALFKGLLPDRNIGSRFTPAWKFVKTIAGAATDVHANVATAVKDVMPTTAAGAALDEHLFIWAPGGSKLRKGATPSRKSSAGRVRGTAGATTAVGDQLIHRSSGLLFQINSPGTIPASPTYVDVDILAISTGAATRLKKGEVLEYLSAPANIQSKVELQKDLDEDGYDQEQDGAARNRLLLALGTPSSGGNQNDYVGWALAQSGISAAFCYPNRAGLGTIDIAALHSGTGTARKLNAGEILALQAAIAQLAPAQVGGPGGSLRVLTTLEETANIELTITPDGSPQYAMDWDDSSAPTVLSWNATTRALQLSAARPSTMQAGHRICLKGVASQQDSAPVVIESLSGTDTLILQTVPKKPDGTDATPASTDIVYAGGPLTATIRDAILAHLNGDVLYAGPSGPLPGAVAASTGVSTAQLQLLAAGLGTSNPGGLYGTWQGTLTRATLAKIAMYTSGVRNQAVTTPAADQDSTDYAYPLDGQIGFLIPGYVLVRKG
ncbi:MAG TPA: baseplate J/gp47 family protein [Kofleriaceae bacterium]|nr:baseplate J/gp47 family protein [Kofleriaceae bacterium]